MATGNAQGHFAQLKTLNCFLGATSITAPTTIYLALFTINPTDNAGGTEVTTSGTAYARQVITFLAAVSGGASPGSTATQNAAANYPVATANYGTVTGWAIFDASSAGNMLYWGAFTASQAVSTGNQAVVPSAAIVVGAF